MSLIEIKGLSKSYSSYKSEWHRVLRWFGADVRPVEENWVLKNINFSISEGEAVGIVGQNGAGKSTLLKILSGTLKPTNGHVKVNGKIAAILELGMGFDPDLTGRQNVVHTAGLMGIDSAQIISLMKHIEDFAEIGEYFDEPVRTYSSGMQVRVAFSVATAFNPDILIVDEALSVGDVYFQHKSFERIRQLRNQGATLLIVSHDRASIQSLCSRVVLLEKGSYIKDGAPEEIMDYYNALIAQKENSIINIERRGNGKPKTTSGTGEVRVIDIALLNSSEEKVECIGVGDIVTLRVTVKVFSNVSSLVFGYAIKDRLGQTVFGTNTWHTH
jgi:lipopolysaccharide transport system ATP-binding protein